MGPPPSLVQFLKDFGVKRSKAGRGGGNYGDDMECTCHSRQRFISYHPPNPHMGMMSPRPRPVLRCHPKCHPAGSRMHEHSWRECCDRGLRMGGGTCWFTVYSQNMMDWWYESCSLKQNTRKVEGVWRKFTQNISTPCSPPPSDLQIFRVGHANSWPRAENPPPPFPNSSGILIL